MCFRLISQCSINQKSKGFTETLLIKEESVNLRNVPRSDNWLFLLEFFAKHSLHYVRKGNSQFAIYFIHLIFLRVIILLVRDMVVERWNRRFGCEIIHPTQKFILIKQMSCVITRAQLFLTSEVVEAVRGHKHHTLTQPLVHPSAPVLLTKYSPRNLISYDLSLYSASISRILEPSLQGLISNMQ